MITDLNNFAVPLIRYRLGDLATQIDNTEVCPCGRGLPRIGKIEGRIQAMIVGTNNQFVPGSFFARLFADYEYMIRQFQVVQEEFGQLKFRIVKADLFNEEVLQKIISDTKKYLRQDLKITIEFLDLIEMGMTGKRQHSVSKIDITQILSKI